jgi:DNA (cytosine-5)-methyltransferase 1
MDISTNVALLRAIDLFAGAGGFSLGFSLAGIEVVAAVEYHKPATKTYAYNFPRHLVYHRDINQLGPEQVERDLKQRAISKHDIDLVIGGPPCPGFSNIGRSKIISLIRDGVWDGDETRHRFVQDPRNTLFLRFVDYVKHFQPRGFVMENVTGMMTSMNKDGIFIPKLIEDEFDRIGYTCHLKELKAEDYGVPQVRRRLIFIGWNKDRPEDAFSHPAPTSKRIWTSLEAISDLPDVGQDGATITKRNPSRNEYQRDMRFSLYNRKGMIAPESQSVPHRAGKLSCHQGRRVNPRDRAIFPELQHPKNGKRTTYDKIDPSTLNFPEPWTWNDKVQRVINPKKNTKPHQYKWYDRKQFKDKMRRIPYHQPCYTLVAHMHNDAYMFIHPEPNTHRTITPRESARIQSFPDHFDFSAGGTVPFTEQYRQIGNAVPPLMAMAIAGSILEAWNGN